ncbi:hypothetical protein acdb102_19310 [Acidothermaceae bacterium B102]|nr:hypothetical protein acdb102_19310 [Acidothermaceae bacterium B102]
MGGPDGTASVGGGGGEARLPAAMLAGASLAGRPPAGPGLSGAPGDRGSAVRGGGMGAVATGLTLLMAVGAASDAGGCVPATWDADAQPLRRATARTEAYQRVFTVRAPGAGGGS